MFKVVIDINIFVSSLIKKDSVPARLIQLWRENAFLIIISEQMLKEIQRVLQYPHIKDKYKLTSEDINLAISSIEKDAIVLTDVLELDVIKEDPDDNKVLACALEVRADYIISGDKHLLDLRIFEDIPIVKVKEYLDILDQKKSNQR
ncbi:MAG: putative toxin-antitoxin system toxin component, PIN family [bacterium]